MASEQKQFETEKEDIRMGLLKYTRQALRYLPEMKRPRILDIGCGTGVPTLELARLTDGYVIGVDNDARPLGILEAKISKTGLAERVKTVRCSIEEMDFPLKSFDLIWAEGCIFVLGFQRSLQAWRPFLKHGGFLVLHDQKGDTEHNLRLIAHEGFKLISWFELLWQTWWDEYYVPLKKLVADTQQKAMHSTNLSDMLREAQAELEAFEKDPRANESIFYIMQKEQKP